MLNINKFKGALRFDARIKIMALLKEQQLFVKTTPHKMVIPICSRTSDIIEPLLKPQWYVACDEMAAAALSAVESGQLRIMPKSSEREWFAWLKSPQDWCISRQLWWGHQIPAYFISIDTLHGEESQEQQLQRRAQGEWWVSAGSDEEALVKAARFHGVNQNSIRAERDVDVLDTWFSSALWPFAIFGWPEKVLPSN